MNKTIVVLGIYFGLLFGMGFASYDASARDYSATKSKEVTSFYKKIVGFGIAALGIPLLYIGFSAINRNFMGVVEGFKAFAIAAFVFTAFFYLLEKMQI